MEPAIRLKMILNMIESPAAIPNSVQINRRVYFMPGSWHSAGMTTGYLTRTVDKGTARQSLQFTFPRHED